MFLVLSAHKRCPYFILIWVRYKVYFVSSKPDLCSNLFSAVLYVISCYIGSYWKETTLYKVLTIWYRVLHGIVFSPNIEAWTKWLIFCQWLFLMHFIERRLLCLDTNISLQFAPSGPVDNESVLVQMCSCHDDIIKWKHFPRYWPFVRGIHRSPVNSPHKGQWCGVLMFSLICVWINSHEAGDLRCYHTHYDVTVM